LGERRNQKAALLHPAYTLASLGHHLAHQLASSQKLRQLRKIDGDPPCLVFREQLGCGSSARLILEINIRERLPGVIAHDKVGDCSSTIMVAGSDVWAWCGLKALFRDGHHRTNDRVVGLCMRENSGRPIMKTLLMGIAFAMGMVFGSQAFALPCPSGTWQNGHYVCASYDE
jgi:hypothetical protein